MADLTFDIGTFDAETRTVPVTFTHGEIRHLRSVNACLDSAGNFDAEATEARIREVARGVAHKIAIGVIVAESDPVQPEAEEEPQP